MIVEPTTVDMASGIVQQFKYGVWQSVVIDRNHPSRNHSVHNSIRYMVRLDDPNGYNTSWPIRYENGAIGYEFKPPRDARRAVIAAYRWIQSRQA